MPYKMKMSDGREVDVVTVEEHNAALSAKESTVRAELTTAVTGKEQELAKLKIDLAKLSEKDMNFTAVKEKADKAESDLKALRDKQAADDGARITSTREAVILKLAGGNKVLAEKITKEYGIINLPEATEAEVLERAKKAFYVAAPSDAPKAIDSFMSMTGGRGAAPAGTGPVSNDPPVETPEQSAVRRKMGISDEDYKKYGARAAALASKK